MTDAQISWKISTDLYKQCWIYIIELKSSLLFCNEGFIPEIRLSYNPVPYWVINIGVEYCMGVGDYKRNSNETTTSILTFPQLTREAFKGIFRAKVICSLSNIVLIYRARIFWEYSFFFFSFSADMTVMPSKPGALIFFGFKLETAW